MEARHTMVLVAVAMTLLLLGEVACQGRRGGPGQQGFPECQRQFQTGLLNCASSNNVDIRNFLWVATNRSMGQMPANLPTFRTAMCGNAQAQLQCMETFISQLLNSSACQPAPGAQDLRPVVDAEFGFVNFNIRQYCGLPQPVPPCQQGFENNLVACAQNSSLDTQSFLWVASNQSRGQAPADQTAFRTQFCGSVTGVLQCVQTFFPLLLNSSVCLPGPSGQDFRPILETEFNFVTATVQIFCGLQPSVPQQPATSREVPPCQQNFENNLVACAQNSSLDTQSFLWVASNQSRGQAPADQTAFRTQFCSAVPSLLQCGETFMRQLFNSTQCQAAQSAPDFRPVIDSEFRFVAVSMQQFCGRQLGQRENSPNM